MLPLLSNSNKATTPGINSDSADEVDRRPQPSTASNSSEMTVAEPLIFQMPEFRFPSEQQPLRTIRDSVQSPQYVERAMLRPSRTQLGSFELTVPTRKAQEMMKLPVWKRFPFHLEVSRCWDPFSSVIQEIQQSPEQLELYTEKQEVLLLLLGHSKDKLANAVFQFMAQIPFCGVEKYAINLMWYNLSRVHKTLLFQSPNANY